MDGLTNAAAAPASTLGMALIISSQAPVVLLDGDLNIVAASATFYRSFKVSRPGARQTKLADLGNGEWNKPQLLLLLRSIASGNPEIEAYEMDLVRPDEPVCHLVVNAHLLDYASQDGDARIVLAITDLTAARLAEKQNDELLHEKQVLMQELQHRVANSLQIIASVLLQSARKVNSEESRSHLNDAHHRVMSIATLQKQLAPKQEGDVILRTYFGDLCESISASMIADSSHLTLSADIDNSAVDARISVSLGLIVTELVINSLKHAFPKGALSGKICVDYHQTEDGWILSVEDDGIGFPQGQIPAKPGLGTGIIEALAGQLGAHVVVTDAHPGTRVAVMNDDSADGADKQAV